MQQLHRLSDKLLLLFYLFKTKTIKLNQSFNLGKDETIKLKEYRTNDLGTKIIYDRDIHNKKYVDYDLKLVGNDDLGNDIGFYLKRTDEKMRIQENEEGTTTKNIEKIKTEESVDNYDVKKVRRRNTKRAKELPKFKDAMKNLLLNKNNFSKGT